MDKGLGIQKVSIIMPAYNVENYIEASIESVLNQTYINWELIIIDDGSVDKTASICKKFTDLDSRIIYIYQNNTKQAKARNNGINIAKGEILAFLDADDLWLPKKLELSLLHFNSGDFDLIFTDAYYSADEQINISDPELERMGVPTKEYFGTDGIIAFIELNRIPMLTVLVKKTLVEKADFFDEEWILAEDYDLWLRLLKNKCVFKSVSLPLSVYRTQGNSSTASDRLATEAVLKSLMKNFNADDIMKLSASTFVKSWIRRWISLYLTTSNINQLKMMLNHFKYENLKVRRVFLLYYFIGFHTFKRLILKAI